MSNHYGGNGDLILKLCELSRRFSRIRAHKLSVDEYNRECTKILLAMRQLQINHMQSRAAWVKKKRKALTKRKVGWHGLHTK